MPENEVPVTLAGTGWLYQSLKSGARAGTAVTLGPDASYLNCALVAVTDLPALSRQVPLTVAVVESGPEYVAGVHETIPENEVPLTVAVTGWLYQPLKSGARAGAAVAVGEDVSMWRVYC